MRLVFLLPLLVLTACADGDLHHAASDVPLAIPDEPSVATRVAESMSRLESTEAGQMVLASINAHGGLHEWYSRGPIGFRYRYERVGTDSVTETDQIVDTWSSRAVHTLTSDSTISFGWTGNEAWVSPEGAELPSDARFWSLTPYYFIAMPFVLADPGVILEEAGQTTIDEQTYNLVYVTFAPGTGDAPDDYYYVLIDPETNLVGGVRYIVSYPGFFPEGGNSPETVMLYDGTQTVDGITLQEGFRSFLWNGNGRGDAKARGSLSLVQFQPTAPDSMFKTPYDAFVLLEM